MCAYYLGVLVYGEDNLSNFLFVSTAQEKSNIYPSHSYNTSLNAPPNSVSPPAQEDLGAPHKNGDSNVQDHAVINFTTATTCDTITIHSGKAINRTFEVILSYP